MQSLATLDKFSSCCAESEIIVARKLLPACDTLGPCRLSCTCVDSNLDPFRPLHFNNVNVEIVLLESTDFNFNFWFSICWFRRVKIVSIRCILGLVLSFRTTFVGVLLAPTVIRVVSALSTIPSFNRILVLVLLRTPVSSLLSLLSFAFALAVLAFALFALCQTHRCPLGRLLLGVTNLSVSRFVPAWPPHSCFDLFFQDTIRIQSRTVQLYMLLEIIWQQIFNGTHADGSSARLRTFPRASRRPQQRLTRSSILSMAPHQLRQLHSRWRQNLPQETSCSSRCVRVPPSVQLAPALEAIPPADITTSKLSRRSSHRP